MQVKIRPRTSKVEAIERKSVSSGVLEQQRKRKSNPTLNRLQEYPPVSRGVSIKRKFVAEQTDTGLQIFRLR